MVPAMTRAARTSAFALCTILCACGGRSAASGAGRAPVPPLSADAATAEPEAGAVAAADAQPDGVPTPDVAAATAAGGVPRFGTVFTIVLENRRFGGVIGNPHAPYANELAARFALAGNYHAGSSPSLPNYLTMLAGQDFGVHDDEGPRYHPLDAPQLADQLEAAGLSWRAYFESMPAPCTLGPVGNYAVKHNPFVYFAAVRDDRARCDEHDVPFALFADDLAQAPRRYMWIGPDMLGDGHDTGAAHADRWLAEHVPLILESAAWRENGVLFLTWDEGQGSDEHIPMLVISPLARPGHVSPTPYDHRSFLATVEDGLGLPRLATTADVEPMADLFRGTDAP
jgi:hypothetical protein